ncbi:hypothetical protein QAD02_023382 [Eretmocerus hayati]|uniref:Uncharacterized protein n=2 Tax=Eretmocerus hayati TaxID=131215 RepID=A0ACC2PWU0_9HYME|nr:hypothetical protein QAD02_002647 [Eretmocerus hayati]KAJ8687588.1 hypothetical protein QAD02_023382 [Eretmocerus hayati]
MHEMTEARSMASGFLKHMNHQENQLRTPGVPGSSPPRSRGRESRMHVEPTPNPKPLPQNPGAPSKQTTRVRRRRPVDALVLHTTTVTTLSSTLSSPINCDLDLPGPVCNGTSSLK